MKHGFICTAAATPKIRVADPVYNGEQVLLLMRQGAEQKAKVMVFPELCLTGYTCDDLFFQNTLLKKAKEALKNLIEQTANLDMLAFVGLPWEWGGKCSDKTQPGLLCSSAT